MPEQPPNHDHRLGEDQVPQELKDRLQKTMEALKEVFPGMGLTLMVFDFEGGPQRMLYVSNAERATMVQAMQEFVGKQANA